MSLLFKIDGLVEGDVIKRPSKFIKTPYVADIMLKKKEDISNSSIDTVLGHTASLGCCGLADAGARILMAPVITKKNKEKSFNFIVVIFINYIFSELLVTKCFCLKYCIT
jgi:hypothetical protein